MCDDYDIPEECEADPKHAASVLKDEIKIMQTDINVAIVKFINKTGVRIKNIALITTPDNNGNDFFLGTKVYIDI